MITVRVPDEIDELGLGPIVEQVIRRLKKTSEKIDEHAKTERQAAEAHERLDSLTKAIIRDFG